VLLAFTAVTPRVEAQQGAEGCWDTTPDRLGNQGYATIRDMAASPDGDLWAVGTWTGFGSSTQMLGLRWDGRRWNRIPMPSTGEGFEVAGVTTLSKSDAWAVGSYYNAGTSGVQSLTLHWNGTEWKTVPSPNPSSRNNYIKAVTTIASDDVWAVGYFSNNDANGEQTFTLHWDGRTWTQVPSPNVRLEDGSRSGGLLFDVSAFDHFNVWAVGFGTDGHPLSMRWDGEAWRIERSATSPPEGVLYGVSALKSGEVWAAGIAGTQPVTLRWNGVRWEQISVPAGQRGASFRSVTALSPTDVWAVGSFTPSRLVQPEELAMHWDGSKWTVVQGPIVQAQGQNPPIGSSLDTSTAAGGQLWVGGWGTDQSRQYGLLSRRANVPCSALTATPVVPLEPPVPVPGPGSRQFPETGKTMAGLFLDYWTGHGGLAQQGYPISDVLGEVSDLNGKPYTMQYTERAVFEYHPENQPPYNVLLSQLGTFQYKGKYPNGAPNQRPNNTQGSVLFKETGKRLGGRFLEYWQKNGGLMQQGYPISEEFTEVSDLNGKPYTVQYFERAVFEYHPENARPYDVLLSHLGLFRYNSIYHQQPGPSPTPSTPLPTATPRLLTQLPDGETVGGNYVFWRTGHAQVSTIDGYDLDRNRQFVVTVSATNKNDVVSDGRLVVWDQDCPPYCHRIRAYDIQAAREYAISEPVPGRTYGKLWLDGGKLYYQKYEGQTGGLYEYNLETKQEKELYSGQFGTGGIFRPVIGGGTLLWMETNDSQTEWTLHMRKIDGSVGDTILARAPTGFSEYQASGDNIVWSALPVTLSDPQTDTRAFVYNLTSRTSRPISAGTASNVQIKGNMVAWKVRTSTLSEPTRSAIEVHDLSTGRTRTALPERLGEIYMLGLADGDRLVFSTEVAGPSGYTTEVYALNLRP
ncbi:MAG TPA: hypothetical protein VM409_07065, partial [Chloroflexia bacterium]|nr:hypothetical protein [Chloroflexia bacterium]